jgi:hypothetical protein
MQLKKSHYSVGVLLVIAGCLTAQTQVTINPSKDKTLYENNNGSLSNGAGTRCFAGLAGTGGKRRAVMAFDVRKQIPAGSTITKADLVLTVVMSPSTSGTNISLHVLNADWGEAGSKAGSGQGGGGTAQTNDATWVHTFFNTKKWKTTGGDFNATASGSTSVGGSGAQTWSSTKQMVADVQSWLDKPATNFGWLLLGDESSGRTARAFATKEASTASVRPRLIVTYTPPKASVTSTGTGCRGTANTNLTLSANGVPSIGNAKFALGLSGGPAGNGLFGLGLSLLASPTPLGGGCNLYVNTLPILVVFGGNANRSVPLPIPNDAKLIGITVHWQAALADPKTGFLITSNALTVALGL